MPSAIDTDWMISVDDHVVEPADLWSDRLPSKLASSGPRVETLDDEQVWVFNNKKKPIAEQGARLFSKDGLRDLLDIPRSFDDLRPGCYDPLERVKDMDAAYVSASLCFPSFPRFAGQEFLESDDRSLALDCVRVYNDWMINEWCAAVPGRLIPLVIVPLWDGELLLFAGSALFWFGLTSNRAFDLLQNFRRIEVECVGHITSSHLEGSNARGRRILLRGSVGTRPRGH